MIKVAHLTELERIKVLPKEVIKVIEGIVVILDKEYGEDRDAEEDGGYVLLVESTDDFEKVKDVLYLDLYEDAVPEFVDKIICSNGEVYTNSLILCNNDFGISIIMPLGITPDNLIEYIIE